MIYTAIDTFYLTNEEIQNSPSRKDGIDEATELNLRIYGCDLIQESGILMKLPQVVMTSGQVLFHRFYCKKSFVRFNVKRLATSCVWVASKLKESPRKARHVINVFHRMECQRENLPIEHLDSFSKEYKLLKKMRSKKERTEASYVFASQEAEDEVKKQSVKTFVYGEIPSNPEVPNED